MSINSFERRFDYLDWQKACEAASVKGSTVVWPFGACEQHGPHLPLVTDTFFAENILNEILCSLPEKYPVWALPPQAIGFSPEHLSFPGTLSISASVFIDLVTEIGDQLASFGFKRLVFFNAHGGQIGLLQAVARQLKVKCPSMAVLPCFLWSGVDSLENLLPHKEVEEGLHAALAETSLMLSMQSNLVGDKRPVDGINNEKSKSDYIQKPFAPSGWSLEGSAPCAWLTNELSETGVIGDSRNASAELGDELRKVLVDHWTNLFSNLMESDWPPTN